MTAKACAHIEPPGAPELNVDRVLAMQVYPAEALATCASCGTGYLLELLDMQGDQCAYRVAAVDKTAFAATLKSLDKGSCDIQRGRDEIFNLAAGALRLNRVLISRAGAFNKWVVTAENLPSDSWQELPMDGSWLARLNQ